MSFTALSRVSVTFFFLDFFLCIRLSSVWFLCCGTICNHFMIKYALSTWWNSFPQRLLLFPQRPNPLYISTCVTQFSVICGEAEAFYLMSCYVCLQDGFGAAIMVDLSKVSFLFLKKKVTMTADISDICPCLSKVGRKGHVVLLSPPDEDSCVSESVCQLGSLLCNQGFSVSVDQWSRKEQCDMGPLPWLHSQLLKLKSVGGRVLLILTQKTLERTEEWTRWSKDAMKMESNERPLPQFPSPYSDLFTASLLFIHADKLQGRAGERFVLVKFDSNTAKSNSRDRSLPELLHGLSLFHLPSQTQSLLAELTVVETERESARRPWTGWKWRTPHGPRV